METSLSGLIVATLLVVSALMLARSYLSTQDALWDSWQAAQARVDERSRTEMVPISYEVQPSGQWVDIVLRNQGTARLADFDRWDVIIEYDSGSSRYVEWLIWVPKSQPGFHDWSVWEIYRDAEQSLPEVFEPGIWNPGEEAMIRVRVKPGISSNTTNRVTLGTANGISTSMVFEN